MARNHVTPQRVREWALEHLRDPDGVAFNRYTRIATKLDHLEGRVNELLTENGRLQLQLSEHKPIIAHRVTDPVH